MNPVTDIAFDETSDTPYIYFCDSSKRRNLYRAKDGKTTTIFRTTSRHISCAAFTPDGTLFISDGSERDLVKVLCHNNSFEEEVVYKHRTYLRDFAFDPKGDVYFSEARGAGRDGVIYRLDLKSGYIRNSQHMIISSVCLYSTFRYIHSVRNFDGMCAGISTSPAVK